jgi:hypothetical protein
MKLILKLPEGKPPFIGVEFATQHDGAATNHDLILNRGYKHFKLLLEMVGGSVNIRLYLEQPVEVRNYSQVKCNNEELKRWHKTALLYKHVNFGHVYSENGVDRICKIPYHHRNIPFTLKVDWISLDHL